MDYTFYPPSCYTFAFDGLSTAAAHTAPPVLSCRADLAASVTALFTRYPIGILARPCFPYHHYGDGFRGVSPNSRKLVLATEEFNFSSLGHKLGQSQRAPGRMRQNPKALDKSIFNVL
ncbi:MAG: hypothetical protein K2G60_07180 [Oscillospiraceae bacterium]|nr:hypothetical protein [Oscillospiraceae bacterium]